MSDENLRRVQDRAKKIFLTATMSGGLSASFKNTTKTAPNQSGCFAQQIDDLRSFSKELKLIGEDDLATKISCAISAIAGTDSPKTEYSYSYIMRKLRKGDKDRQFKFQITFKNAFDDAMDNALENPEQIALIAAIMEVDFED